MFGKMIYYDAKAIREYYALALGENHAVIDNYSKESGVDAKVDASIISVGVKNNKVANYQMANSLLLECSKFEKAISDRDDYLDFTTSDQYDVGTASRGYIIKFEGLMEVPEQFDLIQLLDRFGPFLDSSIEASNVEEKNKDIVRALFNGNDSFTIPLILDLDDFVLCGKVKKENLLISYDEMEEYADEAVTVLARLSSAVISSNKCYYDPLKDFMHLNRAMRKKTPDRIEGMEKLYLDTEYRKVDVLAIYV